ncbi:uncharacterized protein LOC134207341 [Armigeres subalbatus]|uniref:uncharacterized protein LOC134207341 n=1 Tax=Armigeres subalbatus TaxID=124917 RepID=UPI002ED4E3D0
MEVRSRVVGWWDDSSGWWLITGGDGDRALMIQITDCDSRLCVPTRGITIKPINIIFVLRRLRNNPEPYASRLDRCPDALVEFEEFLLQNDIKKKFEKFLASFVLFKKPLKEITTSFIEKVYDLELQSQINYSEAGGKQALKSLCSTQILIKTLVDQSLFESSDDPAALACAEFRYQMQHVCDRIKSSKRRQTGSVSRKRLSRQKLSVPLKMETLDIVDDGGASDAAESV